MKNILYKLPLDNKGVLYGDMLQGKNYKALSIKAHHIALYDYLSSYNSQTDFNQGSLRLFKKKQGL